MMIRRRYSVNKFTAFSFLNHFVFFELLCHSIFSEQTFVWRNVYFWIQSLDHLEEIVIIDNRDWPSVLNKPSPEIFGEFLLIEVTCSVFVNKIFRVDRVIMLTL